MVSLAGAGRTIAGRRAFAGLCGAVVIGVAGCSAGAGGGKAGSGHTQGSPAPAPVIKITPVTGAKGVRPNLPIRVWALSGRLTGVTVRAGGRDVSGQMNRQGT